jgi:hypothetical protein
LTYYFELHGVRLEIDDPAVHALVELAQAEATGARALSEFVLERLPLSDLLTDLAGTRRIIIDRDTIVHGKVPWKVPGEPEFKPVIDEIVAKGCDSALDGVSSVADTSKWYRTNISKRLEDVKKVIDWPNTTGAPRNWWDEFERQNAHSPEIVLRVAEELAKRKATITEFFLSYTFSETDNIQANLHYLDYTRVKREIDRTRRLSGATGHPDDDNGDDPEESDYDLEEPDYDDYYDDDEF